MGNVILFLVCMLVFGLNIGTACYSFTAGGNGIVFGVIGIATTILSLALLFGLIKPSVKGPQKDK